MAKSDVLHDHPRSEKAREEAREAKKGDVREFGGEEYESYGGAGTKKGGNRHKREDDEGDLDEEGWNKARDEDSAEYKKWYDGGQKGPEPRTLHTTDEKNPEDGKGWRREFWRKKKKKEVPTS